jgi:hypothetical protein
MFEWNNFMLFSFFWAKLHQTTCQSDDFTGVHCHTFAVGSIWAKMLFQFATIIINQSVCCLMFFCSEKEENNMVLLISFRHQYLKTSIFNLKGLPRRWSMWARPGGSPCYHGTVFFYLLLPQLSVGRAVIQFCIMICYCITVLFVVSGYLIKL